MTVQHLLPAPSTAVAPATSTVLIHDYLLVMRGAERTFAAIADCFPESRIATLLYDEVGTGGRFADHTVTTSFLQPLAADQRRFRRYLPLLPLAAERLSVGEAQLVVSSSSAFAQGVRAPPGAVHVCYCHSPFRYIWHESERARAELPRAVRWAGPALLGAIRHWDRRASRRVDAYIANSQLTRERIRAFYGREASVVHPPVDIQRFKASPDRRAAFLVVGEVTRHKNIELALAAGERAGVHIEVVGNGPDLPRLARAYPQAEFLGRVGDAELAERYATCRALIVPAVEEFGITMVEAQASGRPVVAAARGGATEIVEDQVTGVLFSPGDVETLAARLRDTDWEAFDVEALRASAARFSLERFGQRFADEISRTVAAA
jgi:glycosyltransferase involved in cell wall biosynthesis